MCHKTTGTLPLICHLNQRLLQGPAPLTASPLSTFKRHRLDRAQGLCDLLNLFYHRRPPLAHRPVADFPMDPRSRKSTKKISIYQREKLFSFTSISFDSICFLFFMSNGSYFVCIDFRRSLRFIHYSIITNEKLILSHFVSNNFYSEFFVYPASSQT